MIGELYVQMWREIRGEKVSLKCNQWVKKFFLGMCGIGNYEKRMTINQCVRSAKPDIFMSAKN